MNQQNQSSSSKIDIGFVLFPQVTQLDFTGPAQVLSRVPGAKVHLVAKTLEPVMTDVGFALAPTVAFEDCPRLDVLCVPGGFGVVDQLADVALLDFLFRQGTHARYVTSVCNGSLLLGAAGLLKGYRSTCHWMWIHYLPQFGAHPTPKRIVRDRNRMSGAGVTSGIDFAFVLAAELAGEDIAKQIQLGLEYDPQPPFDCGSPGKAGPERVERAHANVQKWLTAADVAVANAATIE